MPLLRSWRITFRGGLATNMALLTELSRLLMSVKNAGQARRHTIAHLSLAVVPLSSG